MMRYRITLGYDGTEFCGWQSQPCGKSVQDAVETAAEKLFGERVRVTGSGRTDAGVHALKQVAHFDAEKILEPKNIVGGLNAYLPRTVRVMSAEYADGAFDARKSAKRKTYMYLMYVGGETPVLNDRALTVPPSTDFAAMEIAARSLIGTHDFATFKASGSGAKTSVRTVFDAHFERCGAFVEFFITADGFLYNMVRIIVAQLLKIGGGKGAPDMAALISARDRAAAKEIAPPHALYLYDVQYD